LNRPAYRPLVCFALAAAVAAGCADRRRDDAELHGLVHAEVETTAEIDVDDAARDTDELVRALGLPHRRVGDVLGPHRVKGTSAVAVSRGSEVIEKLADETTIELDEGGGFRAVADNDREYGRHAIYAGGVLYLRPRFGKYHRRAPSSAAEPGQIRDEMFSTVAAYFALLAPRAELSDRGTTTVAGRAARKIEIAAAPEQRPRPAERLRQRQWRSSVEVESVAGEIVLDAESGVPLAADIRGTVHFTRDGQRLRMELAASHRIEDIGKVAAIEAPPADQTVSAARVADEVEDRKKLLDGLSQGTDGS
jgi:hypothetical protein